MPSQPQVCYMCRKSEAHGMKECPDTLTFLPSGIIKMNPEGRIIHSDGGTLLCGIPGARGITKALKEEVLNKKSTMSNLEMDKNSFIVSFVVANYEYMHLNKEDTEYKVMPTLHSSKSMDDHTQPYKHPKGGQQVKKHLKPEVVITTPKVQAEKPVVPTILKCPEVPVPEDVEMSATPEEVLTPFVEPVKSTETQKKHMNKPMNGKAKVSFKDVNS